jgi:hypothetical protein
VAAAIEHGVEGHSDDHLIWRGFDGANGEVSAQP